jgi:hypothetical protein
VIRAFSAEKFRNVRYANTNLFHIIRRDNRAPFAFRRKLSRRCVVQHSKIDLLMPASGLGRVRTKSDTRSSALVHKPKIAGPELNDLILTSGDQFAHRFGGELDDGPRWVLFRGALYRSVREWVRVSVHLSPHVRRRSLPI